MWRYIKQNHFVVISGLETILLGSYLIYVSNLIRRPPIFHHAQDPYLAILLVIIGTFATVIGIFNLNWFHAQRIALVTMLMVWTAYFTVFLVNDINSPGPIGIGTLLIGFVLIRVFAELLWGDKT